MDDLDRLRIALLSELQHDVLATGQQLAGRLGLAGWRGRSALGCRLTRSRGHGALGSLIVARKTLPRTTPRRPCRRSGRATVQRATGTHSRWSWRQTLSAT